MTYDAARQQQNNETNSERSPLLSSKPTPLPMAQLLILAAVRLAEPISYTQIFPYVNEMMERLKVTDDPARIGFYSGLVDSIFAFAQLFTVYHWSSASDRIGRKPILLVGLSGVCLSSLCFGLSSSLITALVSRSLAGMLSGNIAVVSSMVSEMTDSTNQAKAFPMIGATWAIGCVVGPIIGGSLSYPATKYPHLFGNSTFLRQYPYFLPCAVSSMITLSSIILALLFVDETLPSIVAARNAQQGTPYGSSLTTNPRPKPHPAHPVAPRMTVFELLSVPTIRSILASSFMLSFLSIGFEVVFVLCSYTRVDLGGMARSPEQIGYVLAISGMIGTVSSLFVFPVMQRRLNNRRLYTCLMACWPIAFMLMPLGNMFARMENAAVMTWVGIAIILTPIRIGVLNFPLNLILIRMSSPGPDVLGTLFGVTQTLGSLGRTLGPAFASSLFAISIDHDLLHGNLIWVVMASLGFLAVYLSSRVVNVPVAGKNKTRVTETP